jgi:hypothetical protein
MRTATVEVIDDSESEPTASAGLDELAELLEPIPVSRSRTERAPQSTVNTFVLIGGLLVALGAGAACVWVFGRSTATAQPASTALETVAPISAPRERPQVALARASIVVTTTPASVPPKLVPVARRPRPTTNRPLPADRVMTEDPPAPKEAVATAEPATTTQPAAPAERGTTPATKSKALEDYIDPFGE